MADYSGGCPTCGQQRINLNDLSAIDRALTGYGWYRIWELAPERVESGPKIINVAGIGEVKLILEDEETPSSYQTKAFIILEIDGQTYKKVAESSSYGGTDWDYGAFSRVTSKTKTITVWE